MVEVHDDEQQLIACLAQEGILLVLVETPAVDVGIHQVEEFAAGYCFLFIAKRQDALIAAIQFLLFFGQHFSVEVAAVSPATDGVYAPVVEDGGPSVSAAESFAVHAWFSKLLSEVDHHRVGVHAG